MTPPSSSQSPPLCLEDISVSYDPSKPAAVRHVNLSIPPGEVHVLLGRSGSGKTTLLRLIAGFERAHAGKLTLGERTLDSASAGAFVPADRRKIGLVFQDYALFPHMSVSKNIGFGMRPERNDPTHTAELLTLIELHHRGRARPSELSGGEQQRVALARALAMRPTLMLFDEPFSNLDPELRSSLRAQTFDIVRESGTTAILVTHSAKEALEVADRISVLHKGEVLHTDSPQRLYDSPLTVEVARSLGDVNAIEATREPDGTYTTPFGQLQEVRAHDSLARPETSQEGWLLIRPEDIELHDAASASAIPEPCAVIPVERLVRRRYQGDVVRFEVMVKGEHQIRVSQPSWRPTHAADATPLTLSVRRAAWCPA